MEPERPEVRMSNQSFSAAPDSSLPSSVANTIVIIPAFNEEGAIAQVVHAIPSDCVSEIVVVDNGSTDATAAQARGAGATVLSELERGYGAACLCGIAYAMEKSPAIIAFLDGDYSDCPEELPSLLHPIVHDNIDLVIGSRMLGQREPGAMLPQAMFGNWLATTLIRVLWGARFTDLGPFRAIRTSSLMALQMNDRTFGWTVEMQVKAAKQKLRCREIPVRYRKRAAGSSKVTGSFTGTMKASYKILFTIFKHLFT